MSPNALDLNRLYHYPVLTLSLQDHHMSDSVMQVRLPADLLKAFQDACTANDQTASQVVRAMMREYVSRNAQAKLDLGGKRK
jgi:ABC-type transporter MlaC component